MTSASAIHPGEILREEFLAFSDMTKTAFAAHIGITPVALSEIIHEKRGISVNTAQRLSMALGTTPEFWLNLQQAYDLATAPKIRKKIALLPFLAAEATAPQPARRATKSPTRKRPKSKTSS